ncbi:MAG TPA: hypothetical protein VGI87_11405 [Solirubrobacteraceae bacterium]|jgi:hypothetical protein
MLASITPLGERGRHSRWTVTVAAFLLGATAAGAATGALLGSLGSLLAGSLGTQTRLALLAVAAGGALALELSPLATPGPRRQVDSRWLDEYRGWVYGAGYGAQLGVGVATIVTSAATYLALMAAVLSASATSGAVIVGVFGAARGLQPLAAGGVRRPEQLLALHTRLRRSRRHVHVLAAVLLLATAALAAIGAVV